jgi:hypothetical protein
MTKLLIVALALAMTGCGAVDDVAYAHYSESQGPRVKYFLKEDKVWGERNPDDLSYVLRYHSEIFVPRIPRETLCLMETYQGDFVPIQCPMSDDTEEWYYPGADITSD